MRKSKDTNRLPEHSLDKSREKRQLFNFKPSFFNPAVADAQTGINFKNKWRLLVFFTTVMVLTPLFVMMAVDARLSLKTLEKHTTQNMSQLVRICAQSLSQQIKGIHNNTLTQAQKIHLSQFLSRINDNNGQDLFIVNKKGRKLTKSSLFPEDDRIDLTISRQLKDETGMIQGLKTIESSVIAVYAAVEKTGLTLILAKPDTDVSDLYFSPRIRLIGYLIASILVIILSILGTTTYLVSRIHQADKKRVDALHHAESANKLAAIGRLASGVAHEINNPLAIINEKNGLLLDIISAQQDGENRQRLINLASDVTGAVRRGGRITRRLLDFARHMEPSIELVNVEKITRQILSFYEKEAQRLKIKINIDFPDSIPDFKTDKGSLQQIFLNLIENAFDAMKDGGQLSIRALFKDQNLIIKVIDTGTGIAKEEQHKIFEPFYSSKKDMWKTGLGLSITYGLVQEIDGDIIVKSREGKGSQFILTLPVKTNPGMDKDAK